MKEMEKLKTLIDSRDGKPLELDKTSARLGLGYDLDEMKRNGYDSSVIEEHRIFNERIEKYLDHPVFGQYLEHLTPEQKYVASGIRLLPLENIKGEIVHGAAPGGYIFPHGYMVFASSIGGNAICFHAPSAQVVWVDHTSFTEDSINYEDRPSGTWKYLDFTEENIGKAVIPLSDNFENFLLDLLNNRLGEQLDKLD